LPALILDVTTINDAPGLPAGEPDLQGFDASCALVGVPGHGAVGDPVMPVLVLDVDTILYLHACRGIKQFDPCGLDPFSPSDFHPCQPTSWTWIS